MSFEEQRKVALGSMVSGMCNADGSKKDNGFTLGWDVVVSYTEDEINDVLKAKWEKDRTKMVSQIVTQSEIYDEDREEDVTEVRTLELDAPLIRFAGGSTMEPALELIMPVLRGSRHVLPKPTDDPEDLKVTKMPENAFVIKLSGLRLGTVVGKYEEVKNTTSKDLQVVSSKQPCVFRQDLSKPTADDFEVAWVVLDIPAQGQNIDVSAEVTLSPNDANYKRASRMCDNVERSAKNYFKKGSEKIDLIRYALATIKNKPQFDGPISVDLTPVSFKLATFAANYTPKRVLSLFIHTINGQDAGEKANLQQRWQGQWVDNNIAPIPTGYTASILFNPELTFKSMIEPGLERNKKWDVDDERLKDKTGGIAFNARKQDTWYVSWNSFDYEDTVNFCTLAVDGWDKDLKGDPATIHIYQRNPNEPPVAHIEWTFSTESEWEDSTRDEKWYAFGNRVIYGSANIRTTYKLDTHLDLNIKTTDTDVSFNIKTDNLNEKWTMSDEKIGYKGNWLERTNKVLNTLVSSKPTEEALNKRKDWMGGLKPEIQFDVVGLGFFMTTNLLNPGARVIQLDHAAGFRLPKDLLLVGDVVKGSDLVKVG